MTDPHVSVTVRGEYALFSRPEFKVERVSYPLITPSAARGLLEAVFWKPEFRYRIRRIEVIRRGTEVSVLRNEIKARQGDAPISIEDQRMQRTALMLRNVAYAVHADLVLRPHATEGLGKYLDQAHRHVERGSCFHAPYLGTRECAADLRPHDSDHDKPDAGLNLNVGTMLFDVAFVPDEQRADLTFRRPGPDGKPRIVAGYARPLFFPAEVKAGVLDLTPHLHLYDEVDALEGYAP